MRVDDTMKTLAGFAIYFSMSVENLYILTTKTLKNKIPTRGNYELCIAGTVMITFESPNVIYEPRNGSWPIQFRGWPIAARTGFRT